MINYLEAINKSLAENNKHGEIVIAGGAALTLVFEARDSTYDIDAIFIPKEDMREIIKDIADIYMLSEDWLNDGVKGFMTDKMTFSEVLTHSNLMVFAMYSESLLAMKLTAARSATKDMQDSIFLMNHLKIETEKQLFDIIKKYTHPKQQSIASKYFTLEAFVKYQLERQNILTKEDEIEDNPKKKKKRMERC